MMGAEKTRNGRVKSKKIKEILTKKEKRGESVRPILENMLMECTRPENIHEKGFETAEPNGTPIINYRLNNGNVYQWYQLPNGGYRFVEE